MKDQIVEAGGCLRDHVQIMKLKRKSKERRIAIGTHNVKDSESSLASYRLDVSKDYVLKVNLLIFLKLQ